MIPRNNVLSSGALTIAGALLLSYGLGAELLNFGAFIAFMGVNLASFSHYCLRLRERSWTAWFPPLAGFIVCFYIWIHLSVLAKVVGTIWLIAGLIYGVSRGNFKENLLIHSALCRRPVLFSCLLGKDGFPDVGMAVGHDELSPKLVSFPVDMAARGVQFPNAPSNGFEPIWCAWGFRKKLSTTADS